MIRYRGELWKDVRPQVVVDSHIQRIVLATEETTVTQQVSHRPIKCQSRLWSPRGTKVNGSHHGDNPLLRPTGIQIATKSYAALQAMSKDQPGKVANPSRVSFSLSPFAPENLVWRDGFGSYVLLITNSSTALRGALTLSPKMTTTYTVLACRVILQPGCVL